MSPAIPAAALSLAALVLVAAPPPAAPFEPDEDTLLLARFDGSPNASHAAGQGLAEGSGRVVRGGRFGGAMSLGDGETVRFSGPGNFPGEAGTVEFWIRPRSDWGPGRVRAIVHARMGAHDYFAVNQLADGKLGTAVCSTGTAPADFVYRRADAKAPELKAGEWHHMAACWGSGEISFWLDGQKVASRDGAVGPRGEPAEILLGGADCDLDEFCISRIARYSETGRAQGKPVEARARLNPGWKFNEPDGVYRGRAPVDARAEGGMRIVPRNYLDDFDPGLPAAAGEAKVELFASPGEVEPAALMVFAEQALSGLSVSVSGLTAADGSALEPGRVSVRRVVRTPMRRLYTAKPTDTAIVSRFLPKWRAADVPSGEFREIWLSFDIPADARPGVYSGTLTLSHAGGRREVPVRVDVLAIRLVEPPRKALATYLRIGRNLVDTEALLRDLRDMRAHGIRNLFPHAGIRYRMEGGKPVADLGELREVMGLLREAGFAGGTIVVETGFPSLARLLGHRDLDKQGDGASLDGDAAFAQAAREAMEAFVTFQAEVPEFRLFATHLDEVFGGRKLLDQYVRLSRAARQVPQAKLYITFNTVRDENDAMRREIDPFVDLRCNHGYSFEWWLARGHTMDEYEAELRQSGDEAWFYHNARGVHWTPEWSRIINGLYLWAGPFTAHCPWTYQSYDGNPFDDTDGPAEKGHDWLLSAPGPDDPAEQVPTRCYEAMREGADDLRYLATLEAAIGAARTKKPQNAAAAQAFLDRMRGLIRKARPAAAETPAGSAPPGGPVDADTGLIMGQGVVGSAAEAPLIHALATRFSGQDWQGMRRQIADWILRLQ